MSEAIVFRVPGATAEDAARGVAATEMFRATARDAIDKIGGLAVLDGLLSVWVDLHLRLFGVHGTERTLRRLRQDLPRMMAALQASDTPVGPAQ